uniref:Pectin acetylesterase n=1 Tax=Nicotiana sylvestris TaxID=4096 RepID=A0A1U7VCX8_NICSY|nr:PREDICTED: protein notum homolog [Nicotiana sylvestris]
MSPFLDFYDWNKLKIMYYDGASYTGDVQEVDPSTNLHYRGARIFKSIVQHLLAKGMYKAENAILSGTSAGGLAAILNCDKFSNLLPLSVRVRCIFDSGFFVDVETISGYPHIQELFYRIVKLHGSAKNLPQDCAVEYDKSLVAKCDPRSYQAITVPVLCDWGSSDLAEFAPNRFHYHLGRISKAVPE